MKEGTSPEPNGRPIYPGRAGAIDAGGRCSRSCRDGLERLPSSPDLALALGLRSLRLGSRSRRAIVSVVSDPSRETNGRRRERVRHLPGRVEQSGRAPMRAFLLRGLPQVRHARTKESNGVELFPRRTHHLPSVGGSQSMSKDQVK